MLGRPRGAAARAIAELTDDRDGWRDRALRSESEAATAAEPATSYRTLAPNGAVVYAGGDVGAAILAARHARGTVMEDPAGRIRWDARLHGGMRRPHHR